MYINNMILKIRSIDNKNKGIICIYNTIFIILIFNTNFINKLNDYNLKYYNHTGGNLVDYIKDTQLYISKKYNIFNKELLISYNDLLEIIKWINTNNINITDYNNIINDIFEIYLTNENLLDIKDYIKFYNNKLLSDWILKLSNNTNNIFDGNIKINSFLDNFNTNNIGIQTNDYIYDIILIQNFIKNNNNNILNINILSDPSQLNNKLFNTLYFDFPTDVHNIIYKQCCNQIKNLRIRGTNSSCLLLQLISLYLNPNGEAILIIPEQILYNNSKQVISTREYIYNNFNIKKIIHIEQSIYYNNIKRDLKSITNTIKNCIFYFTNTGKTTMINVSKIILEEENIIEKNLFNINKINEEYSFYYKDYLNLPKNNNLITDYIKSEDMFDFAEKQPQNNNQLMLILNKNYNSGLDINISKIDINQNYNNCYFIKEKNIETNFYYTYYLENMIKKNPENFIKRKNNQFDLSKIQNCEIPILSLNKQNTICSYIKTTQQLILNNQTNINMYNSLKISMIENIPDSNMILLDEIIDLIYEENDEKLICINRNSLLAGHVSLYIGDLNTNSYYLKPKNNNFLLEYIYYYLKFKETMIKDMSKLTQQYNLIKSNLLNIKIPNISLKLQNEIINNCQEFDNNINLLTLNNQVIKNKNIFEIINNFQCL